MTDLDLLMILDSAQRAMRLSGNNRVFTDDERRFALWQLEIFKGQTLTTRLVCTMLTRTIGALSA